MKRAKRLFTLLELLIVITLIVLTTALVGINVYKAVEDQRFATEVGLLVNQLRVAQDLMLVMRADVEVEFVQKEGKFHSSLKAKSPIPPFSQRLLRQTSATFSAIRLLEFEGKQAPFSFPFSLKFFANGFGMTQGILRLGNDPEKAPQQLIELRGYPHSLQAVSTEDFQPQNLREKDEMQERLTQYMLTETKEL